MDTAEHGSCCDLIAGDWQAGLSQLCTATLGLQVLDLSGNSAIEGKQRCMQACGLVVTSSRAFSDTGTIACSIAACTASGRLWATCQSVFPQCPVELHWTRPHLGSWLLLTHAHGSSCGGAICAHAFMTVPSCKAEPDAHMANTCTGLCCHCHCVLFRHSTRLLGSTL